MDTETFQMYLDTDMDTFQFNENVSRLWFGLVLCCLMTPGLSKDIRCHVWPYFFNRPHMKWAVSLVFAYGYFNIPLGCEWVHMG